MPEVVVTCLAHAEELVYYPQIRGYYLAKHLARLGLDAEFRQLPLPPSYCRVVISSEYQAEMEWFERHLLGPLTDVRADRLFCMAAYTIGDQDHFSRPTLEWFGERGGVLCLGLQEQPAPFEHWIGVGIDVETMPDPAGARTDVVFDPVGLVGRSDPIDHAELRRIRGRLPGVHLVGTGPDDAEGRSAFDRWVPYGQAHRAYVEATLSDVAAVVPMRMESLGLMLAEAQVSGACIVHRRHYTKDWIVCPEADIVYEPDVAGALAEALNEAMHRNPQTISAQARLAFDFSAVARRTRAAIGL